MFESNAHVRIETPQRYAARLAKHFEHRVPVLREDGSMRIDFPDAKCRLRPSEHYLDIELSAWSRTAVCRCREVVARHLKQVELVIAWSDSEGARKAISAGELG